ncbi:MULTISPECIES: hypothetical protein [Pseudomonas]|jgi:hypothetical protein|uniref:Uncharacterized protein n=1 Tax=Pseudomonas syringae TaxID=317 RepID=A0A085V7U8_PSESX|nr:MULTISPECIES: hypothetical protein [Pseudomonas]EPJ77521.1 hypothetical protein CFII64_25574 [Pseudomonas sp. CFII64]KFE51511.1 hypothetical protein IV02_13085 [Pseudomonas syringae]
MLKAEFVASIEEQINLASQRIQKSKSATFDDLAFGKLGFLLALRRVLNGVGSAEDLGLMDAVNDSLQALKLLDRNKSFLAGIK